MKTVKTAYMAFMMIITPSWASMLELWNTHKLTTESDSVTLGEVTSQWSSWDAEKRMIYTYTKLRVKETIKGQSREEVLIKQPGGEVAGVGMRVHGMASFVMGEKALVFLKKSSDGFPSVVGMAQGKYKIIQNDETGEETAQFTAPPDVEFYNTQTQGLARRSHPLVGLKKELPLRELIKAIKGVR